MKIHTVKCAVAGALFGFGFSGILAAEDAADHFILPEAPPTIEKVKAPPLGQPYLRKQNFAPEFDLSPAQVPIGLRFRGFLSPPVPLEAGVYSGSFGSRGASFVYTSTKSLEASFSSGRTEGEHENLYRESLKAGVAYEKDTGESGRFGAGARSEELSVWDQRKKFYDLRASYRWAASGSLSIRTELSWERGEIEGMDANDSTAGEAALKWQPFEGQSAELTLAPSRDTAFGTERDFDQASFRYDAMIFSGAVLGAGARWVLDSVFPSGYLSVLPAPGLRLSAAYVSGPEKLNWNGLYRNGVFVSVNRGLEHPESVYRFSESVSYYYGEKFFAELRVSQAHWKKFVVWETPAGAVFARPENAYDAYVPAGHISAYYRSGILNFSLEGDRNLNEELPYTPDYRGAAGIELKLGVWSLGASYAYSGPVHCTRTGAGRLEPYGYASVKAGRSFGSGSEFYAACENTGGARIEAQPGFVSESPLFSAGLRVKL